jgi:hypothetical protein
MFRYLRVDVLPLTHLGQGAFTTPDHALTKGLDLQKTFCVYDGPSPEAIRKVAGSNELPVGAITEVRVLDPYFYRS